MRSPLRTLPPQDRRRDVVVGVDGSVESDQAVRWAAGDARAGGHRLVLLTVVEPGRYGLSPLATSLRTVLLGEGRRTLRPALALARSTSAVLEIRPLVRVGAPGACVERASRNAAEVVVGLRGRSIASRLLLGSVAHHLLRTSGVPIVLVPGAPDTPEPDRGGAGRVVVAVGPTGGEAAVEYAVEQAHRRHRDLLVLYASGTGPPRWHPDWTPPRGPADALARSVTLHPDVHVSETSHDGDLHDALTGTLQTSDLLVLGHHAPTRPRAPIVDTALLAVLKRPRCVVAVVPDALPRDHAGDPPAPTPDPSRSAAP